jgi:hypothetical protein
VDFVAHNIVVLLFFGLLVKSVSLQKLCVFVLLQAIIKNIKPDVIIRQSFLVIWGYDNVILVKNIIEILNSLLLLLSRNFLGVELRHFIFIGLGKIHSFLWFLEVGVGESDFIHCFWIYCLVGVFDHHIFWVLPYALVPPMRSSLIQIWVLAPHLENRLQKFVFPWNPCLSLKVPGFILEFLSQMSPCIYTLRQELLSLTVRWFRDVVWTTLMVSALVMQKHMLRLSFLGYLFVVDPRI